MEEKVFDPIRQSYVPAFPEEIIRQKLILHMIQLGYPKDFISVEVDLLSLPHLSCMDFPSKKRRADLICFAKGIHKKYELYPLLLVECKAVALTENVVQQVVGYNHFIRSYFVAIANEEKIQTICYDRKKKENISIDFLPSFNEILLAAKKSIL